MNKIVYIKTFLKSLCRRTRLLNLFPLYKQADGQWKQINCQADNTPITNETSHHKHIYDTIHTFAPNIINELDPQSLMPGVSP